MAPQNKNNNPENKNLPDSIFVLSFGSGSGEKDPGVVNEILARNIGRTAINKIVLDGFDLPLIVQGEIADALKLIDPSCKPDYVIEGKSTTTGGDGSWEVIEDAKNNYMSEHNLKNPVIITHKKLVDRVTKQAEKQGMNPVVPDESTDEYDKKSSQWWTRNKFLWQLREIPGRIYLKLKGKL